MALASYAEEIPVVAFFDHGFGYFLFSHIGGIDEPADERVSVLRTFIWEVYASGIYFALPTKYPGWDTWDDTTSQGERVVDVLKECSNFINNYMEIYHNVKPNPYENCVKVNGIMPFNGE